jgi:hypothetical protein
MEDSIEEIAVEWLEEASYPSPVFVVDRHSFEMIEISDHRGRALRILVPMEANSGICYYLYKR